MAYQQFTRNVVSFLHESTVPTAEIDRRRAVMVAIKEGKHLLEQLDEISPVLSPGFIEYTADKIKQKLNELTETAAHCTRMRANYRRTFKKEDEALARPEINAGACVLMAMHA